MNSLRFSAGAALVGSMASLGAIIYSQAQTAPSAAWFGILCAFIGSGAAAALTVVLRKPS